MTRQVTDNSSTSLDFHQFAHLLSSLVPGFSGGAIYDLASNNLWTSAGFPERAEDEVKLFLEEQKRRLMSVTAGALQPKRLSDDSLLFSHTLSNHIEEPVGTLILLVKPGKGDDAGALEKKMAAVTKSIATILSEGHRLNSELNAMADELVTRYEELNLMYEAADQTNDFAAIQQTIKQLVKNCSLSLNVPFSALILLDKNISINHISDTQVIDNKDRIDKELNRLYSWTIQTNLPLVLNDEKDPLWEELKITLPYKLLSYPVFDQSGNTIGVIVSLKEKSAEDFFNSDRKLLMVMANNASKIIQSNYDLLTGMLNLDAFKYLLNKINFFPSPLVPTIHTLLYIDIDQMKVINETVGHHAGDEVLRTIGNLIQRSIKDKDVAARIGGDLFGVLLYNCSPEQGLIFAKRISSGIAQTKLKWNEKNIQITACMGLSTLSTDAPDIQIALDDAQIACNSAKEEGRNRIHFYKFGDSDHSSLRTEMWWVDLIQESLVKNNLILYCQEIRALKKEDASLYYEILIRIVDDKGEIIAPKDFMPAIERYKLMPRIDRWVISNTLKTLEKSWGNLQSRQIMWSINISGQSFREENFLDFIMSSLQSSIIPPSCICFEITETAAIGNLIAAQQFITSLRNMGCHFALDDFGSGLSCFNYLKNLEIDYIKIDGAIVKDIVESNVAQTMVKAIGDVAVALKLSTIGEFVENDAIAAQLSRLGIDFAQGYFFGRPHPLDNELKNILAG